MKTCQKTHKTAKALESHISKIIAQKGKFSVSGMTIKYSLPKDESKPRGERIPPDTVEMIKMGRVTYRGCGATGKYADFFRIKVHGKEYRISSQKFDSLVKEAGRNIRFSASHRRLT